MNPLSTRTRWRWHSLRACSAAVSTSAWPNCWRCWRCVVAGGWGAATPDDLCGVARLLWCNSRAGTGRVRPAVADASGLLADRASDGAADASGRRGATRTGAGHAIQAAPAAYAPPESRVSPNATRSWPCCLYAPPLPRRRCQAMMDFRPTGRFPAATWAESMALPAPPCGRRPGRCA